MISNLDSVAEYDYDRRVLTTSILESKNSSFIDGCNSTPPTAKKGCGLSIKGPGSTLLKGSSRASHQQFQGDTEGHCFESVMDKVAKSLNSQKGTKSDSTNEQVASSADGYNNMAAALKKVSSNLNRLSKQRPGGEVLTHHSSTNNFSLTSKSSLSRSKSREKTETGMNKLIKASVVDKIKSGMLAPRDILQDKIEEGFKKKSYYNILKSSCKDHADKKIGAVVGSSHLAQRKNVEAKVSNRVLNMIKSNQGAARSCKNPSSRESSKSAQRSVKEKSIKSQKSNSRSKKETPPLKVTAKEKVTPTSKMGLVDRPKSASKSASRQVKEKKFVSSQAEKPDTSSSQSKKVGKNKLLADNKDIQTFSNGVHQLGSLLKTTNSKSKLTSDDYVRENNKKLIDLFKKTNLSDLDEQNLTVGAKRRADNTKTVKAKKEEANSKVAMTAAVGSRSEHIKQIGRPLGTIVKPNALSFKEFGSAVLSGNSSTNGAATAQHQKKKKAAPTTLKSGGFRLKGSPDLAQDSKQKDHRSNSQKRTIRGALGSNTSVFSNSYLVTHVHQVNNFINK